MERFGELFKETLLKALPKMAKKASSVERLDQVFKLMGKRPAGKKCPGIDGIIEEGEEVIREARDKSVRMPSAASQFHRFCRGQLLVPSPYGGAVTAQRE